MKFYELMRAFFRKMVQMCSNFVTTCTIRGTQGAKLPADATFSGRSMVEMLGVLAIIGVLSVGAISGYSKAMMKYKLNKQAEQLTTVFNAIARNVKSFPNITSGNVTSYLIKLGEIPTEMIRKDNQNYIYDIFGIQTFAYIQNPFGNQNCIVLYMRPTLTKKDTNNFDICRNIVLTAKENHNSIYFLTTWSGTGTSSSYKTSLWGDNYCTSSVRCLNKLTMDDIEEICTSHVGNSEGELKIAWPI